MGKLPSLKCFDVRKTVLFLNTHFGHSPTGTQHRTQATRLSLDQDNLCSTQAHLRGTNCRSPLPDGDGKIREEQAAIEMQLFLERETLEDSGVVLWVDVEGFTGRLLDAWECRHQWAVPPGGWTEHTAAAQWTICWSQTYCGLGSQGPA